jgi:hypothetical protein
LSQISLDDVKSDLRVIHSFDDVLLQRLIDSAEHECLRYLNRSALPTLPLEYPSENAVEETPSEGDPVAPDVYQGIIYIVRAEYEEVDPLGIQRWRAAAEFKWAPYRTGLGV